MEEGFFKIIINIIVQKIKIKISKLLLGIIKFIKFMLKMNANKIINFFFCNNSQCK